MSQSHLGTYSLASQQAALLARTKEGHAAMGLSLGGDDHVWIQIQKKTFTNWVNEQLRETGRSINDLETGFCNGLNLIALVEVLQQKNLSRGVAKRPSNDHQKLGNISVALNALTDDGVKLVNIGNTDILEGNLKLILGLVWTLILTYQIGKSKSMFPPKKLMMTWMQEVIKECQVTNFTSDWNDGVALSALADYCRPGLFPNWRHLNRSNRLANCQKAMHTSKVEFNIPMVISPEDFSSDYLDELSSMTYLSYFMKEGSPGYQATLNFAREKILDVPVNNFTTDWNDGRALCSLVTALGGQVPGYLNLNRMEGQYNNQLGIDAGRQLGVEPVISAKAMADPEVEHLGIMAYVAKFQNTKPRMSAAERVSISGDGLKIAHVGKTAHFYLEFKEKNVKENQIRAQVIGPNQPIRVNLSLTSHGGSATYIPMEAGYHKIIVYCDDQIISDCPVDVRVLADVNKVTCMGADKCAVGATAEFVVHENGAGQGEVTVEAQSPLGFLIPCQVTPRGHNTWIANFSPTEPGEWKIAVKFDGQEVRGSPFPCDAFDASGVVISGLTSGIAGTPMTLVADTSSAGKGEISCQVSYQGRNIPVRIETRGPHHYGLVFTPQGGGRHKVTVFYNGKEIIGSPYYIEATDTSTAKVSGDGLKMAAVGRVSTFLVDTPHINKNDLAVTVADPFGRQLPVKLLDRGGGTYEAEYTARETGEHTVEVKLHNRNVTNSPWRCQAYDASKIVVSNIPTHTKEKSVTFNIDASRAGSGSLEIMVNDGMEECLVQNVGNQKFLATFETKPAKTYTIDMKFNHDVVSGSPWKVNTMDHNRVRVEDFEQRVYGVNEPATFKVNTADAGEGDLTANLKAPSGVSRPCHVYETKPGQHNVEFTAVEPGMHSLDVLFGGHHIPGSPYSLKAYDPSEIHVSGLQHGGIGGTVNTPKVFTVDASQAGHGNLEIMVNNGYVECQAQSIGHQKFRASFVPKQAKQHTVDIKFNGKLVHGSPWSFDVIDPSVITVSGDGIRSVMLNKPTWFDVNHGTLSPDNLEVKMTTPSGLEKSLPFREVKHGVSRVDYTMTEPGYHTLEVSYAGEHAMGSPFSIRPFNPADIKVTDMPRSCNLGDAVTFTVDASKAGSGNLEIMVNGGQVDCEVQDLGHQRFRARFLPEEAIPHTVDMTFNTYNVPGSPWEISVEEKDLSGIKAFGEGLHSAQINRLQSFSVDTGRLKASNITAQLRAPSGRIDEADVVETGPSRYQVEYTCREPGTHYLDVKYGGIHINGSPFMIKVADPGLIRVDLPEKLTGFVDKPIFFSVDASQAGSGNLEIMVNRGQVYCETQNLGNQRFRASFVPREPIVHTLEMKFDGQPLKGSPWSFEIADPKQMRAYGEGLQKASLTKMSEFEIDTHGVGIGNLTAELLSPTGERQPIRLTETPRKGVYKAEYASRQPGLYTIDLRYAGQSISNSPYTVKAYDPGSISVDMPPGIGLVNVPIKFTVDASQAGSGNLEIMVNGGQVYCDVQNLGSQRFRASFIPEKAITHTVDMRFDGQPLRGSPWSFRITDPRQIRAYGEGLQKAALGKPCEFSIDMHGLDTENLKAELLAPSGERLPIRLVETHKGVVQAEYYCRKPGLYTIDLRYSGQPISDSPYTVKVQDPGSILVDMPPGEAFVGNPVTFTVDASKTGSGNLEIMVNDGQVFCDVQDIGGQRFRASFVPEEAIPHSVKMKFDNEPLRGSPWHFTVIDPSRIRAYGEGLQKAKLNQASLFEIDTCGAGDKHLTTELLAPNGERTPIRLTETHNKGVYKAEYFCRQPGSYVLDLRYAGKPISSSPYTVKAFDANLISVDMPPSPALIGIPVNFTVDASEAGSGNLEIMVNGGHVHCGVQKVGNQRFKGSFVPENTAPHTVEMRFNELPVQGSPWRYDVFDVGRIKAHGDGLKSATLNKPTSFEIDTGGQPTEHLQVKVKAPDGKVLPSRITETQQGLSKAEYTMTEMGKHSIDVRYAGHSIAGSPYTVKASDARRIKVYELQDSNQGYTGTPISFVVDANSAGSGNLEIMVNKGKVAVDVQNLGQQKFRASFTPKKADTHILELKFNGQHVPGFPRSFNIVDPASSARLYGGDLHGGNIHTPLAVQMNTAGAGVHVVPEANLIGPSGKRTPCRTVEVDRDMYKIEYILTEKGTSNLEVKLSGHHIVGSPFPVRAYDPDSVRMLNLPTGPTKVNEPITFMVDASDAGSGSLDITVNNGTLHCDVVNIGGQKYQVSFVPREGKQHVVELVFNGRPVIGSPWTHEVVDFGRVAVRGDFQPAIVGKPQTFEVLTAGAGVGDLTVNMRGPSGRSTPCRILSEALNTYIVEYIPNEVGSHNIEVIYGNREVNGSPFTFRAYDPRKITVGSIPNGLINQPVTFNVDVSKAGQGQLEIAINSGHVPNTVKVLPSGVCQVTFVPHSATPHHIDIKFNSQLIPGCPFKCFVSDPRASVSVMGAGVDEKVRVGETVKFDVVGLAKGAQSPRVTVTAPNGYELPVYANFKDDTFTCEYMVKDVGVHRVNVDYPPGQPLPTSPFIVKAYDPTKVIVSDIAGRVKEIAEFTVDASAAGEGSLDISVECKGRVLPCQVYPKGNAVFGISFTPAEEAPHYVTVTFNKHPVPGSPFLGVIGDGERIEKITQAKANLAHSNLVHTSDLQRSSSLQQSATQQQQESPRYYTSEQYSPHHRTVEAYRSHGHSPQAGVARSTSKSYNRSYSSTSTTVTKSHSERKGEGKSKTVMSGYVDEKQSSFVQDGDRPPQKDESRYTVTKSAVDTPEYADSRMKLTYRVQDEPERVEEHRTTVTKSHDGPDTVHRSVVKSGDRGFPAIERETSFRSQSSDHYDPSFRSQPSEPYDPSLRYASMERGYEHDRPQRSGAHHESSHRSSSSHSYDRSYQTSSASGHKHDELYRSPVDPNFRTAGIESQDNMAYKSEQIQESRVSPPSFSQREVESPVKSFSTTQEHSGAHKSSHVSRTESKSSSRVTSHAYSSTQQQPELETMEVKREAETGHAIKDEPDRSLRESTTKRIVTTQELSKVRVDGRGIKIATHNMPAYFVIDSRGQGEPEISIIEPNGNILPVAVKDSGHGIYRVEYTPVSLGDHKVTVKFHEQELANSPFTVKVYLPKSVRVLDIPPGTVNRPATFIVDASDAGAGNLEVSVNEGELPASAEDLGGNRYAVTFVPLEPKPHIIRLAFNGENVPGSPFTILVERGSEFDINRVKVIGDEAFGRVPVNKNVMFTIDPQGAGEADCTVHITSPSKTDVPCHVSKTNRGKFVADYMLKEVGEHNIMVRYGGQLVPGSPFTCKAYSAELVKVMDIGFATVGQQASFTIDASKAGTGNLEIIISIGDQKIPNYVQGEGGARFRVSFTPTERKVHSISVKFNGIAIPGSPFPCTVLEAGGISVNGEGLRRCPVSQTAIFIVDPHGLPPSDFLISVTAPSGEKVPVHVSGTAKMKAEYAPHELGVHQVHVKYRGQDIQGSPFLCQVYDSSRVQVSKIGPGTVGVPVKFHVDTSNAGEGILTVDVSCKSKWVASNVRQTAEGQYDCDFVPVDSSPHLVEVTFNNDIVGGVFSCDVTDGTKCIATGTGLLKTAVHEPASFEINPCGSPPGEVDVMITSPTGRLVVCQVYLLRGKIHRCEYRPNEVGPHKIEVTYDDIPIPGSPFRCEVYDYSKVQVQPIDEGIVGHPLLFNVDASQAGTGALLLDIKARGRDVPHKKTLQGNNVYLVSFTPMEPVPHQIYIKFNGHLVKGSPFEALVQDSSVQMQTHIGLAQEPGRIVASGKGLRKARVGDLAWFVTEVQGGDGHLETFIAAPNGKHVQTKLVRQKDGDYKIEYTPTVPGRHQIEVMYNGRSIMGSPFYSEVYDPSRVIIEDVTKAVVGQEGGFRVVYRDAGRADLLVTISSESGKNIPFEVHEGSFSNYIRYFPQSPGKHRIVVTYGGDDVPRSPMTVHCEEAERGMITVTGDGLYRCQVDDEAHFTVHGLREQPTVRVDGPNSIAKVHIRRDGEVTWKVFYTPVEVGIFNIKIFGNGKEVTGSPYHPKVTDPRRLKVVGGWHSIMDANSRLYLKVREEKVILFDISEAGPGELSADVEGPLGQVPVSVERLSDTRRRVCFTPPTEGLYEVSLYWNKVPLPRSPIEGHTMSDSPSISPVAPPRGAKSTELTGRVILRGRGLQDAKVRQPAEFIVDGSQCVTGSPHVTLQGKGGIQIPVDIIPVDEDNVYRCIYTADAPGVYNLNIIWGDVHVVGSPFKVSVSSKSLCDPNKVTLATDSLNAGVLGKELVTKIDTRRAGPGELLAHCVGPHKVAYCELFDHRDGTYTLNIRPNEAGKHVLHVKYDGEHVPGSPFNLRIAGAPDASKVRVYGPGIEHGVLALYQSRFICETRGAGAGQLTVRIRGPKGAFRVEMQRESQKDRTILCKYDPTEPGEYFVHVKWSGVDVPGSPFKICIFDTQEELERYIRGGWLPTWAPLDHGPYSPVYRPAAIPWKEM